jgi:HK97 family phage prohead protease
MNKSDYIHTIDPAANRRFLVTDVSIEKRAATEEGGEETEVIKGYFCVYNTDYKMWQGVIERIAPGAFEGADLSDVLALYNHEDEMLLGRSFNGEGTLQIKFDAKGGYFEVTKANTTAFNDTYENIRLKNIRGCSFAFTIKEETVERDVLQPDGTLVNIYTIVKIKKVYDVGPVNNPAYVETNVEASKRNRQAPEPKKQISLLDLKLKSRK